MDATKKCKGCGNLLPLARFDKHYRTIDGHKGKCRKCLYNPERAKRYNQLWRQRHPEKAAAVVAAALAKAKALRLARPAPSKCPCGNHEQFAWFLGQWVCVPCRRLKSKATAARNKNRYHRRKQIRLKTARLLGVHGVEMAAAFERLAAIAGTGRIARWKIVRESLPEALRGLPHDAVKRLIKLNQLSGSPLCSIGWKCAACPTANTDHQFFDLDHVIPRARDGHGRRSNLQILCPNCHRLKSLAEMRARQTSKRPELTQSPTRQGEPAPPEMPRVMLRDQGPQDTGVCAGPVTTRNRPSVLCGQ